MTFKDIFVNIVKCTRPQPGHLVYVHRGCAMNIEVKHEDYYTMAGKKRPP